MFEFANSIKKNELRMKVWKRSASIKNNSDLCVTCTSSMSICKSIAHVWIWKFKLKKWIEKNIGEKESLKHSSDFLNRWLMNEYWTNGDALNKLCLLTNLFLLLLFNKIIIGF